MVIKLGRDALTRCAMRLPHAHYLCAEHSMEVT